jgi:hypothetical protein
MLPARLARTVRIIAVCGAGMRRPFLIIPWLAIASSLGACGDRSAVPVLHEGLHAASAELTVAESVARDGGYGTDRVEVLVSRTRLRVLIDDARLAEAASGLRAAAATRAVAAAEKALAADPEFPAIDAISVAIVHPASLQGGLRASYTEEVFEFRRGAGAGFAQSSP